MPVEPLNGVNIFYERNGSGYPVIFIHGSWGDHHNWDPVIPTLSQEFDVIRYDRRGHSQSSPNASGTTQDDVDDLLALIDRLRLDKPVAVGNSFGAIVTLKAIARKPDAFRAIVIHEPPLIGLVENDPATSQLIALTKMHLQDDIVSLLEAGKIEEGTRVFVETVAFGPGSWTTLPQELKSTFLRNAHTWADEQRDPDWSSLDLKALGKFASPALITNSTNSTPFFAPIVEKLVPALPGACRFTFQESGHVPHATHPDLYLATVLPFLRDVTK